MSGFAQPTGEGRAPVVANERMLCGNYGICSFFPVLARIPERGRISS
jgi:hypothetical protein